MKTIRNATRRPLRVKLAGGKTLHLGPGKTGQIADGAEEHDSVRGLVEAGEIEIIGEGSSPQEAGAHGPGPPTKTHGRHPPLGIPPKGDR
jgi:hypothetical protein